MTWKIELDDDFAVTSRGNTVSIIIDPVERTVNDYHVSIGGNSWPWSVYRGLKAMVRVPRGAIGSEVVAVLNARVDLLDAIANDHQGSYWDNNMNKRGKWGDDAMGLIAELGETLEGVKRYWDAADWLDWECYAGVDEFAAKISGEIAGGHTIDEWLEEFRMDANVDTKEAITELRKFLSQFDNDNARRALEIL